MQNILKISDAASLALHTTALLAAVPDKLMSTGEFASMLKVSEAHLSKVLQRLVKSRIVKSVRGAKGGFTLAKSGDEISLLDIFEAIEGPFQPSNCLLESRVCGGKDCILGGLLEQLNTSVKEYLTKTKLSSLTHIYRRIKDNAQKYNRN